MRVGFLVSGFRFPFYVHGFRGVCVRVFNAAGLFVCACEIVIVLTALRICSNFPLQGNLTEIRGIFNPGTGWWCDTAAHTFVFHRFES